MQLTDGSVGWIEAEHIAPSPKTCIKWQAATSNRHISSDKGTVGDKRQVIKEVNEKIFVTRLEETELPGAGNSRLKWTKVRTEDGIEGWLMSYYLFRVMPEEHRWIKRKIWRFNMPGFKKHWEGKEIEMFSSKFKEASGVKNEDGKQVFFFNNIYLFKDHRRFYGIQVTAENNIITNIEAGAYRMSYVDYLPFATTFRIPVISNQIGNWNFIFRESNDPDETEINLSRELPGWLAFIIALLIFAVFLVILYYFLKIPFIAVNKIVLRQSLNRNLFNRRILLYAIVLTWIFGYLFYLIAAVNIYPFVDYFWITSLFFLGMLLGNINKWRNDLDYKRCNMEGCHQWTGEDNGTEDLGGYTVTRTVTNSDGSRQRRTQTTRKYKDYRKCSACGHEWYIIRTEVFGSLRI